ncbi:unnamed protein product [Discosporangium mesarthrocarpum]
MAGNEEEPKYFSLREAVPSSFHSSTPAERAEERVGVVNSDELGPHPGGEPVDDSSSDEDPQGDKGGNIPVLLEERLTIAIVADSIKSSEEDESELDSQSMAIPPQEITPISSPLGHGPRLEAFVMEAAETGRVSPALVTALEDDAKAENGTSFTSPLLKPWKKQVAATRAPEGGTEGHVENGSVLTPQRLRERDRAMTGGSASSSDDSVSGHANLSGPAIKKQWEEVVTGRRATETSLHIRRGSGGTGVDGPAPMLGDVFSPAGSSMRSLTATPFGFPDGATRPSRSGSYNPSAGGAASLLSTHLRTYAWAPDEEAMECMGVCGRTFTLFLRRHHCRCCGGIFCHDCSKQRCLIPDPIVPPHKNALDPTHLYRVCDACFMDLQPSQEELIATVCNAQKPNKFNANSPFRHCNPPIGSNLAQEIRKAANTLNNVLPDPFKSDCSTGLLALDQKVATGILQAAKGLLFVTVVKVGFIYVVEGGTGLCVARLADESWSAPTAVAAFGMSWGMQAGCQFVDLVVPLFTDKAVEMLKCGEQVSVELGLALALGPLGRTGACGLSARAWPKPGLSTITRYSQSKGLFFGVGLGMSIILVRQGVNEQFYGTQVTPWALLSGVVARPTSAGPLYQSLDRLEWFLAQ